MGHPSDIFTSPPSDSYICAVCTDVLEDAVSFKECGHTFCHGCATTCLSSKKCPSCRVKVTGFNPSFIVREVIGSMEVKCPHLNEAGVDDQASKRARGNVGEAVLVSSADKCNWVGKCSDLQNHEAVCDFKIVACTIDGCTHECRRRDMNSHLSGDGFLHHMNLMKQNYEKLVQDKTQAIVVGYKKETESMKKEIASLKQKVAASDKKIKSMQKEIASLKTNNTQANHLSDNEDDFDVMIEGCGIEQVNGGYKRSGEQDGAPKYIKKGFYQGEEAEFTIYKNRSYNGWLLSVKIGE
jgi:hypothetical protein